MAKAIKPKRLRRRGSLPVGYQWRDGRPAWIPSPTRRKQGWRRCDLKDAWGQYLGMAAAIGRAKAIADAVEAWSKGVAVPPDMAAFAPKDAASRGAGAGEINPRSIGVLLEGYYASADFAGSAKIKGLARKTQADYRSKIKRLLEAVADPAGKLKGEKLDERVTKLKGFPIDMFLPPAFGHPGEFELDAVYHRLREQSGEHMANGCLAAVSAWFGWCVDRRRVWPSNPAKMVKRSSLEGRIRVASWDEIKALVAAAVAAGEPSIADAILLGVDLSWAQQDLLVMREEQIVDWRVRHRRIKTGNAGNPPLLQLGRDCIDAIRARRKGTELEGCPWILVCEATGKPWVASTFQHHFAVIRDAAVRICPSVADLRFQDMRDTCVTFCVDAGLSIEEICSRTLHSPKRAQDIVFNHYGAIRQGVADRAAIRLDEHFASQLYILDPTIKALLGEVKVSRETLEKSHRSAAVLAQL